MTTIDLGVETPPHPPAVRRRGLEGGVLVAILCLAAVLRFQHLADKSFWVDEYFTIQSVNGTGLQGITSLPHGVLIDPVPQPTLPAPVAPWYRLLRPDPQDIHPPLYYVMLRMWSAAFGYGEVGLRSFSVAASLVAIALLFMTVRTITGLMPAVWAALIMAVAQPQIEFAQEARSYAVLEMIGLALCLVAVRIERFGVTRGRCVALAATAIFGLLTHYFAASAVAAVGLYLMLRLCGWERRRVFVACLAGVLVFAGLWGRAILLQRTGASGIGSRIFLDPGPGHLSRTLFRLIKLPGRYLGEPLPDAQQAAAVTFLCCLLPLVLLKRRRDLLLWTLWVPVNIAPTLLVDLLNPTWSLDLIRYTLLASPAFTRCSPRSPRISSGRRGICCRPSPCSPACCRCLMSMSPTTRDGENWATPSARSSVPVM